MKRRIWIVSLLCAAGWAQSNSAPVAGRVLNNKGQPVEGADVLLHIGAIEARTSRVDSTVTNRLGKFSWAKVKFGTYRIVAIKKSDSDSPLKGACDVDVKTNDLVFFRTPRETTGGCSSVGDITLEPRVKVSGVAGRLVLLALADVTRSDASTARLPRATTECAGPSRPGVLRGKVTGGSGTEAAPVRNATVSMLDLDGGAKGAPVRTGPDGCYEIKVHEAGEYLLRVAAEGYRIALLPFDVDERLEIFVYPGAGGDDAQRVALVDMRETRGPRAEVELRESARRYIFEPAFLEKLPLPGIRNPDELVFLVPGVFPPPQSVGEGGPGITAGVGSAGQFAANGMRARENNFTVDGADNNEEDVGVRRQGFVALSPQPLESIAELQVITALADARYGRNIGAQVHAVSKAGSPALDGGIYGFLTNQRFNARDFFDGDYPSRSVPVLSRSGRSVLLDGQPMLVPIDAQGRNPFTRAQLGAYLGGRVPRTSPTNPVYFYFAFEHQQIEASRETHFAVPTVAERGFLVSGESGLPSDFLGGSPMPGNWFPASHIGSAIFSLYPFPNNPGGPYGANTYTVLLPATGIGKLTSLKLDRDIPALKSSISVRYSYTVDERTLPSTGAAIASVLNPHTALHNMAVFLNTSFNTRTGQTVRASFGRTRTSFTPQPFPGYVTSSFFPTDPYLINRPLLVNVTESPERPEYVSGASARGRELLRSCNFYESWGSGRTCLSLEKFGITEPPTAADYYTGPLGQVEVAGYSPVGYDVFHFPQQRTNNSWQLADTVTLLRGPHRMALGLDYRRIRLDSDIERNSRPKAYFGGAACYPPALLRPALYDCRPTGLASMGIPTGFFHNLTQSRQSSLEVHLSQLNLFFHDQVAVRPRLSLSYGLRWEINGAPDAGSDFAGALNRPRLIDQAHQLEDCPDFGERLSDPLVLHSDRCKGLAEELARFFPPDFRVAFNSDRFNLLPRFGVAWDPTGSGKTAVRAGFSAFAGQFPGAVINESRNVFPSNLPLNYANQPIDSLLTFFPNVGAIQPAPPVLFNLAHPAFQSTALALSPGTLNLLRSDADPLRVLVNDFYFARPFFTGPRTLGLVLPAPRLKNPYSFHYGVTVERQFVDWTAALSYLETAGRKLLRPVTPLGGGFAAASTWGVLIPRDSTGPFLPGYFPGLSTPSRIRVAGSFNIAPTLYESSANSSFRSLQLELRKRYSTGLQVGGSFTWAHAIDDASDFFDNAGAFSLPQDSEHRSERGSSNFDARLRTTLYFVWDLKDSPILRRNGILRGLQISGIYTAQSGPPFTVNTIYDLNQDGNLTDRLDNTVGLAVRPAGGDRRTILRFDGVDPSSLLGAPDFLFRNKYVYPDVEDRRTPGRVGRNTFRADGLHTLDLALARSFRIAGRDRLWLRAEAFNAFNRTQFAIPVRILEAAGFGQAVRTLVSARIIQFSAKLDLGGRR